jgi:hypothetical protein
VATAAKGFQAVHQLLIVHFIDRGVDRAAAAIRFLQEVQNFVPRVARKIFPGLESRRLQICQELTQ